MSECMTMSTWLRKCVEFDSRKGEVTLPSVEILKIADYIERLEEKNHELYETLYPNKVVVTLAARPKRKLKSQIFKWRSRNDG